MKRDFRSAIQEGVGQGLTEQVMGAPVLGNMMENRHKARMININDVVPDRTQPRRTMPSWLRARWNGRPETLSTTFSEWWAGAQDEVGREIDVEAYLFTEHELEETSGDETGEEDLPTYRKFMRLLNLAYDIRHRGLDTPIEVANGMIIYGERRWLAFQLLHSIQPDERQWQQMPAILSKEFDVWKQAAENGVHQELNAIGIARMLAKLVMDIYGWNAFQSFEALAATGAPDRAFYAQVAEGNKFPVPSKRVQDVMTVLGLKNPSQLRQYRAILRLRDDAWVRADDEDRPERFLRDVLKHQDLVADLDELWKTAGVTMVTPKASPPPSPGRPTLLQTVEDSTQKSRDAARQLALKGDPEVRDKLRKKAEEELQWWQDFRKSLDL